MANTVTFQDILRGVALRVSALLGVTVADLQTTYGTATLTSANFNSAVFPFASFVDAILYSKEKLYHTIANTGNHPYRTAIQSQTASIAHEAVIPALDSAGKPVIGIYGSVFDATDGTPCTEGSLEQIKRRVANANSFWKVPVYKYKIDGGRIYHTRTNVKIDVCTFDRAARKTALNANGVMLLPDVLEEAVVCGAVAYMFRDDEFTNQAAQYAAYFKDTLDMISRGLTSVPSKSIPSPSVQIAGAT